MLSFINLRDYAIANRVDYNSILSVAKKNITNNRKKLSVIVPAYGRESFSEPLFKSFLNAAKRSPVPVSFTLVEHSEIPLHERICSSLGVNHIWIPKDDFEPFNKCLAMNIGSLIVEGEEYIFHDLDCLVQSNFFSNLYLNINSKESEAIQTFSDRRVLYLDRNLTYRVLNDDLDIDSLKEGPRDERDPGYNGVTPPGLFGAPGGSIWIKSGLFFRVGGYDANLFFGYSPEDIFFWNKVCAISKMDTCTDPRVEIFHMKHPLTENSNPHAPKLHELHRVFAERCSQDEKEQFIKLQEKFIKEAINE